MNKSYLTAALTLLTLALPNAAQESRVDHRGFVIGSEEHIAANKRMHDLLLNPTFITVRMGTPTADKKVLEGGVSFKQQDNIRFDFFLTHSFTEPIELAAGEDLYSDMRPELFRDGDVFPYLKKIQDLADQREKKPESIRSVPIHLKAGKEYLIGTVDVKEWYGDLPSGHYQLSVRRRFVYGGKWIQSDSLTFEVH